ncbi:MAG: hypothetical protein VW339_13080, partial [Quisquiliibacterium sp.]
MRQVAFSTSLCLFILAVGAQAPASFAQEQIEPVYSIWDVELGQSASRLPDSAVAEIACGTAGGPAGQTLSSFYDFASCQP